MLKLCFMSGDNSQEERISNFSSRSSSGIALNEEAGQCVQKWEEPIDLSFFDCYFAELHVEQVTNPPCNVYSQVHSIQLLSIYQQRPLRCCYNM